MTDSQNTINEFGQLLIKVYSEANYFNTDRKIALEDTFYITHLNPFISKRWDVLLRNS